MIQAFVAQEKPTRHFFFLALVAFSLPLFWTPLSALFRLSLSDDRYTHTAFIPFISLTLAYLDRKRIFREPYYSPFLGVPLLFAFALIQNVAAVVGFWTAAFLLCYGPRSLKAAAFPMLFLLLAIPIPVAIVEKISIALQIGSADIAHWLFKLCGIPVFREGFVFALPGITIQVAEECSGIRSSIALVITGILASHMFLRSPGTKLSLVVFAAFVGVFKNAVRIVSLSAITSYTKYDLLNSPLHHQYGGMVFSAFAVALIVPCIFLLLRLETSTP